MEDFDKLKAQKERILEAELIWSETKGEKSRTYYYDEEVTFTVDNVVKLCVRPSGNHRLETADGTKFIIAAGWIAIEIDAPAWEF